MKKFDDYTAAELFAMREREPQRYTALLNEKYGTEGQAVEGLPTAVAVSPSTVVKRAASGDNMRKLHELLSGAKCVIDNTKNAN